VSPLAKKRQLTPKERAAVHRQLQKNMINFRKEYGFDTRIWGFDE
jgi:hypothetical protein